VKENKRTENKKENVTEKGKRSNYKGTSKVKL
jgi:hypothetical protein